MIPVELKSESEKVGTHALVNSGAAGRFIDRQFAEEKGLERRRLMRPIRVLNVDGTRNKTGFITEYVPVTLTVHGAETQERLLVTRLGRQKVILGLP